MTHPGCTELLARARAAELEGHAAQARAGRLLHSSPKLADGEPAAVMIRFAGARDMAALGALAELDSARHLALPVIVAELEGELRAALSLLDGRSIADPFHPTLALVELLRVRAHQLGGQERDAGLLAVLRHPLRTLRAIRAVVAAAA